MDSPAFTPQDLSLLWAKLPPSAPTPRPFHPLMNHMVDVAMVARVMWREVLSPAARRLVAGSLQTREDEAGRWTAFWAGLHDLGKASPAFQQKDPLAPERLKRLGLHFAPRYQDSNHGAVTAFALPQVLQEDFRLPKGLASHVATVVGGHHGVFPRSEEVNSPATLGSAGKGGWRKVRLEMARNLAGVLALPPTTPPGDLDNATAMVLAGLVSVADWIGSNETYFPYAAQDIPLHNYAAEAEQRAQKAMAELAWSACSPSASDHSFGAISPRLEPRPLQREAVSLAEKLDGPSLVVIEAPTGEGKTEAAMYLADWANLSLGQRGYYFALPTQATSDQMFGRVRDFLAHRYPEDVVQLQLLHGHATLSAEFELLKRPGSQPFQPGAIYDEGEARSGRSGSQPHVVAAEWFTHRKRGLLAPFGVGTIDQALLSVLQTKHVFVRLFGLSHKTVIVDEVHAYDTYMSALLERLLKWLASLGSSVVLLSATLPNERRQKLMDAYARGIGREPPALDPVPYPRLTWVSRAGQGATHVATSEQSAKELRLEWVDGRLPDSEPQPVGLGERLQAALANGGCAAVICNTVGRAQLVYLALKRYFPGQADDGGPELDLLHARYLFQDRQTREKRSLVRFGKPGGTVTLADGTTIEVRRPKRAVLVATQVIEQSLDLDFDLMVSDLAPADLVLQRAGRLHRHKRDQPRPAGLETPQLWIVQPEVPEGIPDFGQGTEAVYDKHVLLRSWLALKDRAVVRIPEGVEDIIEAVYDDEQSCPTELPEGVKDLVRSTREALLKERESDTWEAEKRWLKPPDFSGALWRFTAEQLEEDSPEFHQAHQALTRLSETTVQAVFLYGTAEHPCLDLAGLHPVNVASMPPTVAQAKELLMRSVSVSDRRVVYSLLESEVPRGWRQSPLLRHHRLLVLDESGSASVGRYRLRLNDEVGLTIEQAQ